MTADDTTTVIIGAGVRVQVPAYPTCLETQPLPDFERENLITG